jgi:hypothetical protein
MQTTSPSHSMRIYIFAILDKAKHDKENIRLQLGGGQAYDRSSD